MVGVRTLRRQYGTYPQRVWKNRYLRIVGLIMVITLIASFYIYQRVWVRRLVAEVEDIRDRTEEARLHLTTLKAEWVSASSIAGIEAAVDSLRLGLRPTIPAQNYVIRPQSDWEKGRYAGLIRALEKLRGNIPLVAPSEAEANQLFDNE